VDIIPLVDNLEIVGIFKDKDKEEGDSITDCEAYLPRCTVGSRQAEYKSRRVDGRGRYGKEYGNSLVWRETNR